MTDRHCCDGRCYQRNPSQRGSCPLDKHEPVYQRPARKSHSLAVAILAVALIGGGVAILRAPVPTSCALMLVGPR